MEANYDLQMLREGPYPWPLKKRIEGACGHMDNVETGNLLRKTMHDGRQVFLAHLSKTNNTADTARDTVSTRMGINRLRVQCMEWPGDVRTLTTKV
jgi:phosphoribosyl 1,2-cyclic phosphodiesterase